ncbi:MAG: histidinol dehydrogenase, partial [Fimbriimonadaceae bacterium]
MIHNRIVADRTRLGSVRTEVSAAVVEAVREILDAVRTNDDRRATIAAYARQFDAREAEEFELFVTADELEQARLEPKHHDAIREAIRRVRTFHEAQLAALTLGMRRRGTVYEWSMPAGGNGSIGVVGQRLAPVQFAGIYAPGGKAVYPSSIIMNAVPAMVAGIERLVVATPARPDGTLHAAVLVAARELGITKIVKAGGAYAIGALAFGLGPSMPPCDVVAGPGNQYVNEAKRQLWGQVGTDLYAGPSEVAVFVDATSEPSYAAADLLTQVEHAEDNVAYLISTSRATLDRVLLEVENQLRGAPRAAVMRAALAARGV